MIDRGKLRARFPMGLLYAPEKATDFDAGKKGNNETARTI